MSHVHNGIYEFNSSEITGLTMGQAGFKLIGAAGRTEVICGTTPGYEKIHFFVGVKAVEDDSDIQLHALAHGDDFAKTATYTTGTTGLDITVPNGDTIYGVCDKITVAAGDYVLAYIGR